MSDLIELRNRILAVHNGTLPKDAVSDDELRAAITQLREDRRKRSTAVSTTPGTPRARSTTPTVQLEAISGRSGGLLDMMKNLKD
jgi:hypothetical protein